MLCSNDMPRFYGILSTDVKELIPPPTWNHFQMRKTPISPRVRLAKNLRILIDMQELTVYGVAEAAAVDPKTVYNLLKATFDPRMSRVEKIANVFGLTTWQLLAIDMEAKPPDSKQVLELLEHFSKASDDGRKTISQVAEIAANRTSP